MKHQTDEELYSIIGANIKKYRELSGLTQNQLAEKLQISISYVSKLEAPGCNKSISISLLNHIANELGTNITCFFTK